MRKLKKITAVSVILALVLMLCLPAAAADELGFLGKPFPDFSVADTEGNTFTLSGQLKDHDAVLINIWATWCNPCRTEFAYLQDAWEEYGDRVAFIALSAYQGDSMEKVAAYREENGFTFPMGLDTDGELYSYAGLSAYPDTIIVDRFGNAAFFRSGSFMNTAEIRRTLDFFTGANYTETVVLQDVPADCSTRAYPVSAKRALHVDNQNVKMILIHIEGVAEPYNCYVVPEEKAHLRFELAATDSPEAMEYVDSWGPTLLLSDLLDPESGAYGYDQSTEATFNGAYHHYSAGMLADFELGSQDPSRIRFLLIRDDAYMDEVIEILHQAGYQGNISWEYADSVPAGSAPAETDQAYTVYVVDQYHHPVLGVYVNFCTDAACRMVKSDENGMIIFDGTPDIYHLQIVEVPEGYSFNDSFELYTDRACGDWVLYIQKD